jgi:putative oxidoreductase
MIPERYAPVAFALFRIVFGYTFLIFGVQKLLGWFGAQGAVPLMSQQGAAGVIETVAGLLIMLGLFTKPAAFIASGEMAVAYFYVHVMQLGTPPMGPGLPSGLLIPHMNRGVDATLYCTAFLYIATRGAGLLSLDHVLGRSKSRR